MKKRTITFIILTAIALIVLLGSTYLIIHKNSKNPITKKLTYQASEGIHSCQKANILLPYTGSPSSQVVELEPCDQTITGYQSVDNLTIHKESDGTHLTVIDNGTDYNKHGYFYSNIYHASKGPFTRFTDLQPQSIFVNGVTFSYRASDTLASLNASAWTPKSYSNNYVDQHIPVTARYFQWRSEVIKEVIYYENPYLGLKAFSVYGNIIDQYGAPVSAAVGSIDDINISYILKDGFSSYGITTNLGEYHFYSIFVTNGLNNITVTFSKPGYTSVSKTIDVSKYFTTEYYYITKLDFVMQNNSPPPPTYTPPPGIKGKTPTPTPTKVGGGGTSGSGGGGTTNGNGDSTPVPTITETPIGVTSTIINVVSNPQYRIWWLMIGALLLAGLVALIMALVLRPDIRQRWIKIIKSPFSWIKIKIFHRSPQETQTPPPSNQENFS